MQLDKVLVKISGKATAKIDNDDRDVLESSFMDYKGDFDPPKELNLTSIDNWFNDLERLRS